MGVGEASPSGVRTGSGRNEELDVDYPAAVMPACPDDVGRETLCNVPSACGNGVVEEMRLEVNQAAESKLKGDGLAGPANAMLTPRSSQPIIRNSQGHVIDPFLYTGGSSTFVSGAAAPRHQVVLMDAAHVLIPPEAPWRAQVMAQSVALPHSVRRAHKLRARSCRLPKPLAMTRAT